MEIRFLARPAVPVFSEDSLMDQLQRAGVPVASSCGGKGVCCKCRVQVKEGAENLSPLTPEEDLARGRQLLEKGERLSCQCHLEKGSVTLHAPYWPGE